VKYNVIPGEAVVEIDCRLLPGTTEEEMRATVLERMGPELAAACEVDLVIHAPPVDAPASGALWDAFRRMLVLDPGILKLHLSDHRRRVLDKFAGRLRALRERWGAADARQ